LASKFGQILWQIPYGLGLKKQICGYIKRESGMAKKRQQRKMDIVWKN